MRQAQESDIIRFSMDIRAGFPVRLFKGNDIQILSKQELNTGVLLWADQILCATNKTRKAINNQMRELLGHEGPPQDGDKLICCTNYWDKHSIIDKMALVNGTIGYLKDSYSTFVKYPKFLADGKKVNLLYGDFVSETGSLFKELNFDKDMIMNGNPSLTGSDKYAITRNKMYRKTVPYEFNYGYAITTHKAQGSQWDKVLVIEEGFPYDKTEHSRWVYTAITRAVSRCVLIKGD
jgi:exodeoxyribonuclease-5